MAGRRNKEEAGWRQSGSVRLAWREEGEGKIERNGEGMVVLRCVATQILTIYFYVSKKRQRNIKKAKKYKKKRKIQKYLVTGAKLNKLRI